MIVKNKTFKQMIEDTKAFHQPIDTSDNNVYCPFHVFAWTDLNWHDIDGHHKDRRVIRKLQKRLSRELFDHVAGILNNDGASYDFSIVRYNYGSKEYEELNEGCEIGACWIDEQECGGYSGDSFSGDGYIKISKKDYLMFRYSM